MAKTYQGGPCKHCGGTTRWESSRTCVNVYRCSPAEYRHRQSQKRRETSSRYKTSLRGRLSNRRSYYRCEVVGGSLFLHLNGGQ